MSRCPQVTFASVFVCGVLLTASLVAGVSHDRLVDEACDIDAGVKGAACNGRRPGDTKDGAGLVETDLQQVLQQALEEQEERQEEEQDSEEQDSEEQDSEEQHEE